MENHAEIRVGKAHYVVAQAKEKHLVRVSSPDKTICGLSTSNTDSDVERAGSWCPACLNYEIALRQKGTKGP